VAAKSLIPGALRSRVVFVRGCAAGRGSVWLGVAAWGPTAPWSLGHPPQAEGDMSLTPPSLHLTFWGACMAWEKLGQSLRLLPALGILSLWVCPDEAEPRHGWPQGLARGPRRTRCCRWLCPGCSSPCAAPFPAREKFRFRGNSLFPGKACLHRHRAVPGNLLPASCGGQPSQSLPWEDGRFPRTLVHLRDKAEPAGGTLCPRTLQGCGGVPAGSLLSTPAGLDRAMPARTCLRFVRELKSPTTGTGWELTSKLCSA